MPRRLLLTHATLGGWISQKMREMGAEVVEGLGSWDAVGEIHSDVFLRDARRREAEVLAAAAVAEAALGREGVIFYAGGTAGAGLHASRGAPFNASVFLAKRLGAAVVAVDRHFPWGTWELHLEHKFPLYLVYGGAEGPSRSYLAKRGHDVVAFPIPPGAGDRSFGKVLSYVLREVEGPLVLQLGFDIHRKDPTGYFFASEAFFYRLGEGLRGRERFYISIECPSTPAVFTSSLSALLSGLEGGGPPPVERYEESGDVLREVDLLLRRARGRLS
ncbi:MAG: histone deacetylase family protein [Pyrobaculum sp.]